MKHLSKSVNPKRKQGNTEPSLKGYYLCPDCGYYAREDIVHFCEPAIKKGVETRRQAPARDEGIVRTILKNIEIDRNDQSAKQAVTVLDFLSGVIVGELTFEYLNNGVFEEKSSSKKLVNSGKAKALANAMLILSQALAKGKVQRLDREVVGRKAEMPVILRDGDIVHASMKIEGNMQRERLGRPTARPECINI